MLPENTKKIQAGFSLVEIMVGMLIGLIVTLVVTQVLGTYDIQKRRTSGTADAQTNGALALYAVQREAQIGGYGLPLYDQEFNPFGCTSATLCADPSCSSGTATSVVLASITYGGSSAGSSDSLSVNYGTSPYAGAYVTKRTTTTEAETLACPAGNSALALQITGAACQFRRKDAVADNSVISCPGDWLQVRFHMQDNELRREETRLVSAGTQAPIDTIIGTDIVAFKAQYGISATADDNQITNWVNADGIWQPALLAGDPTNRNRIKALRIAVVARNGEIDNAVVTGANALTWAGSATSPIDLSNTPNWQRYRYRIFETVIPLRNMIWSRESLE